MSEKLKDYGEILTFLILETLAFVSFTLGNSLTLYFVFGLIAILAILFLNLNKLKELEWTKYLIFLIPFIIFAILSGFSKFTLNNYSLLTNFVVSFSLLLFITLGFVSQKVNSFKLSTAMTVIYGGLAILVGISLIYSMIRYVPFYPFIYEGKYIYYEGERILIDNTAKMLMGFRFEDMEIQYFQIFGILLFTSIVGLKFISPKKETKKFIVYCIYALTGLLAISFTMTKINLVSDLLVLFFLIFILFIPKKRNWLVPTLYSILGVVGFGFIIFFINAQSGWEFTEGLRQLIANNWLLNKLFNANRISTPIVKALNGCLSGSNLFGFSYSFTSFPDYMPSNMFLFDTIIYNGIFAAVALVVFIIFTIKSLVRYFNSNQDDLFTRNLVICFIGTFFIYGFFALSSAPYSHYSNLIPMQQNAMFLIVLFLIGKTLNFKNVDKINKEESINA